jgi:D-alanyl-lipoteichoic acid acyltransferase DltB (MBOAT superfamily)
MQEALQRPLSSAIFGVLMLALPWILLIIAGYSVYLFFPLAFLIFLATPLVFCILLAIGIAAVSGFIGSLLGFSDRMEARIAGAALLVGLMLIPVLGFLIMLAILTFDPVLVACIRSEVCATHADSERLKRYLVVISLTDTYAHGARTAWTPQCCPPRDAPAVRT